MYTTILYNFINTQEAWVTTQFVTLHPGSDVCSKKSQNTPRPSEHPPVMGFQKYHLGIDVDVILGNCTKHFVLQKINPRQLVIYHWA